MRTLGQVAFEAYNESKGGLTYDGKPIPPWDSLTDETGQAVQRAWHAAADAILRTSGGVGAICAARGDAQRLQIAAQSGERRRGLALAITKLDEAEMWFERALREGP